MEFPVEVTISKPFFIPTGTISAGKLSSEIKVNKLYSVKHGKLNELIHKFDILKVYQKYILILVFPISLRSKHFELIHTEH